jgi:hypothetical protein
MLSSFENCFGRKTPGRPAASSSERRMLPRKPPFLFIDQHDLGAQALDQVDPLRAHPVGHENDRGMPQGPADGAKRDARVAAGRFGNQISLLEGPPRIPLLQDMECHAVLDAAGHVQVFGLGINDALLAAEHKFDGQKGGIADQRRQFANPALGFLAHGMNPP